MSNQTKWTPGPWTCITPPRTEMVSPGEIKIHDERSACAFVVSMSVDEQKRRATSFLAECCAATQPNHANAHLIAAAPDLYEALLLALVEVSKHETDYHHVTAQTSIDKITAALSKARGEKPLSSSETPTGVNEGSQGGEE